MILAQLLLLGTAYQPPAKLPDVGAKAAPFEARTIGGENLKFPGSFKGKIVLLDFWATWCQPCLMDMPNVVEAYEEHHKDGFEILSVSLDDETTVAKIPTTIKQHKMTWQQVCDERGWDSPIAKLYGVKTLPTAFIVDGDTGEVLATRLSLLREGKWRGAGLAQFIEQALKDKKAKKL